MDRNKAFLIIDEKQFNIKGMRVNRVEIKKMKIF